MASAQLDGSTFLQDELTCPVCLDMYRDPFILTCGHVLCKQCLDRLKERTDGRCFYCPECRHCHHIKTKSFRVLKLAHIADELRYQRKLSATVGKILKVRECWGPSQEAPQSSGCTAVPCDYCPFACSEEMGSSTSDNGSSASVIEDCEDKARASSVPAVKTCLKCEVSMCAEHLKPHRELPAFRNHQLTEPMADFWKRKCPTHNIIYSHYCMDHKVYLCNICSTGHSGHNVRTLENAMKDIKVWLFNDLCRLEKSYSLTEKTLKEQEENERRTKSFLDTCLTELMGKLQDMVLTYVRQLQDMVVFHYQISADSIQENISRILVDQARLQDVRCAIESLLLENDPFRLIEDYQIKRNEFTEKLQQNLSELEHSHFPLEEVTTLIKNKTNAFIHEELLSMVAENTATFTSLCHPLEESPVGDFRSSEEDIDDDADLAFNVLHPNIPEEVLENNDHSTDEGEEDFESDEGHDDGLFSDVTDPGEEEEEEEEEGEEEEEEGYVDEDEAEEQEEEEDEEQGGEEEDGDENEYEYGSSDADDE